MTPPSKEFTPKFIEEELEGIAVGCGSPFVTSANYNTVVTDDLMSWDPGQTALLVLLMGGNEMGLNVETNPNMGNLIYDADVDGKRLINSDLISFKSIGFTDGNAYKVRRRVRVKERRIEGAKEQCTVIY